MEIGPDPAVGHPELASVKSLVSVVWSWNRSVTLQLVAWYPDGWLLAGTSGRCW